MFKSVRFTLPSLIFILFPCLASEQLNTTEIIEITGSRLNVNINELSSSVQVITEEDIVSSGANSIADLLQKNSLNSFGARKASTGRSGEQGLATLNLRGLGAQRTLILVNSQRIANSAAKPDVQNLNAIPLSSVERIEILKSGASAIYGSDAIGGVVNIILKKHISEQQLNISHYQPKIKAGEETSIEYSGGFSNPNSHISYLVNYQQKQQIVANDMSFIDTGFSRWGYPATYQINAMHPETNQPLVALQADERCPNELSPENQFSQSQIIGGFCQFNFKELIGLTPELESFSTTVMFEKELANNATWSANIRYNRNHSNGLYPPTPSLGSNPLLPTMAANNINNPTQHLSIIFDSNNDGYADTLLEGPFDLDIFYRNIAAGQRKTNNIDENINLNSLIEGDWSSATGYKWELFLSRDKTASTSTNLTNRIKLQQAINDTSFDIFAINQPTNTDLAKSFALDSSFTGQFDLMGTRLSFDSKLFTDKFVDTVYGAEAIRHEYFGKYSDEFSANHIDGRSDGGSSEGDREVLSAFIENQYKLTKDAILSTALRYDYYSDFGSQVSPKLGVNYRVSKALYLRANIELGYRAPSLFELFSNANQSMQQSRDLINCQALGDQNQDDLPYSHPCFTKAIEVVVIGNKNLEQEESQSFTTGLYYNKKVGARSHRLDINFYYQTFDNEISLIPLDELLLREGNLTKDQQIIRSKTGQLTRVVMAYDNFYGTKTAGFDIDYQFNWASEQYGEFSAFTQLSAIYYHKTKLTANDEYEDISGDLGKPEEKINFGLKWHQSDYMVSINMNYIPSTEEYDIKLKPATIIDVKFDWQLTKDIQISMGLLNAFNQEPIQNKALGWPYFIADQSMLQGRTPYIQSKINF